MGFNKMDTGKTAAVKLKMEINFGQEKTRHLEYNQRYDDDQGSWETKAQIGLEREKRWKVKVIFATKLFPTKST